MTESRTAVFLSYASDDADAAQLLCAGLRGAGIEVWFDQSELRGGDSWDHRIRQQIRNCALFIPVISQQTQARGEGYFRLEWNLADQRSHMIAPSKAFIVPVCVDGTREDHAEVPDSFLKAQWTRLPGGEVPAAFSQRIAMLLEGGLASPTKQPTAAAPASRVTQSSNKSRGIVVIASIAFAALGLLAYRSITSRIDSKTGLSSSAAVGTTATSTESTSAVTAANPGVDVTMAPEKSIAVLPFVNMSPDKDQEYFADGLSEELIDHLTHNADLKVISRTSSFAFKGKNEDIRTIAAQLGVSNLLEGSVRKSGAQLRITVQLIRAKDGLHLWSQTYDRKLDDIFKIQDEISATVAKALNVLMVARTQQDATAQPRDIEAYNLLLEGNYSFYRKNRDSVAKALSLYQQAIKIEPTYAPAWVMLSQAYAQQGNWGWSPPDEAYAKARDAALKGVKFGPELVVAHTNLGWARATLDWDWNGARLEFERARALDPNNQRVARGLAFANHSIYGRMGPQTQLHREELARNPLDTEQLSQLASGLQTLGQFEESAAVFRRLLKINPAYAGGYCGLGVTLMLMGRLDEAVTACKQDVDEPTRLATLPMLYWDQNRREESDAMLHTFEQRYGAASPYVTAQARAYRGEVDSAFAWLDRAYRARDVGLTWIRSDQLMRKLHDDPRYTALLKKMKLLEG